jgi:hypothetical protein
MLSGEWWLDESGNSTFADGDVSDADHASIAFEAALGLSEDEREEIFAEHDIDIHPGPGGLPLEALGRAWLAENDEELRDSDDLRELGKDFLVQHGANRKFLNWYEKTLQKDPRDYALKHMDWIRVQNDKFQVQKFDDSALHQIRNSDLWDNADEPEKLEFVNEPVEIEELSSGRYVIVPYRVLFDSSMSAARILSYGERAAPGQKEDEGFSVYSNPPKTGLYHGTSAERAAQILKSGFDLDAARTSDPGDFGWGLYLTPDLSTARAYGDVVLRVILDDSSYARIRDPYNPDLTQEADRLFHALAFQDGYMLTCFYGFSKEDKKRVSKAIRDEFLARGYGGISSSYRAGETVVFDASTIREVQVLRKR